MIYSYNQYFSLSNENISPYEVCPFICPMTAAVECPRMTVALKSKLESYMFHWKGGCQEGGRLLLVCYD